MLKSCFQQRKDRFQNDPCTDARYHRGDDTHRRIGENVHRAQERCCCGKLSHGMSYGSKDAYQYI